MTKTMQIKDTAGTPYNMVLAEDDSGVFPKHLAATSEDRLFVTFSDFDTVNDWELIQTGSGMTIGAIAGGAVAGASPYLPISTGVTAAAKTIIASRGVYRAPVEVRVGLSASQRIANTTMRFGFLECTAAGVLVTDVTRTTAPELLNAKNGCMLDFTGTVVTNANLLCRQGGGGAENVAQTYATYTSAATGPSPNFLISDYMSLSLERDRVSARNHDANILTNTGTQLVRDMNIPNPTKYYRFYIIVENGATAPATSTDWRLHFVNILDATRFDVSPRHGGVMDGQRGFPVNLVGTSVALSVTNTPVASTEYSLPNSAATTNATLVKAIAGRLTSLMAFNASGTDKYLKLYKKATAPTVGTDLPFMTLKLPAGSNFNLDCGTVGITFATGLGFAITGAAGDTDTTAVAANDVKLHMTYL